jgi:hypothetical protein
LPKSRMPAMVGSPRLVRAPIERSNSSSL